MRIVGKTKSHRQSLSTYGVLSLTPTADHTTGCSLPISTAIFQVDQGRPVPECLHSAFYWSD